MPTGADFETLIINVGGIEIAGKMLKSKQGWEAYEHEFEQVLLDANGIDKFGFKILPGGNRLNNGVFRDGFYYAIKIN